jgi:hypothetical protein
MKLPSWYLLHIKGILYLNIFYTDGFTYCPVWPVGCTFCASGYKVSGTVRKGILQVDLYEGAEMELMLGMFAALSE